MPIQTIRVEFKRAAEMRYDTCGDWFDRDGELVIQVSDTLDGRLLDDDERFLIALHELVEVKLCQARGISQESVDAFDMAFEGDGEPGDDGAAPYRKEHRQASVVEFLMASFLGMDDYGFIG